MPFLGQQTVKKEARVILIRHSDVVDADWKVNKQVIDEMLKNGFNLGGEQSGHVIFRDFSTTGDGLVAALHWYGEQFARRTGVAVVVEGEEPVPRLATRAESALFRITQEALNNIVKHSGARHAWVRLRYDDRKVELAVEDDGCGFDTAARAGGDRPAWGLLGMQERAHMLGGSLVVESKSGAGTTIVVEIPSRQQ